MASQLVQRGVRTLAWNQALRMGEFALTFAGSLLYARWLGPQDYGRYSLVMAVVGLLPLLVGFGLDEALSSYTARLGSTDARGEQVYLIRLALGVRVLTGLVLGGALAAFPGVAARAAGDPAIAGVLPLAAPYLIASQLFTLLLNVALGRLASGAATAARLVSLAAGLGLAALLLRHGLRVSAVLIALGASSGGAAAWLIWLDRRYLLGPARALPIGPIWRFGWRTWLLNLANYVLGKQLDLFVVSNLLGQAALVGAYNIALGLAAMVGTLFIAGLGGAALPLYSALAARGDDRGLAALWRGNVLFTTLLGLPVGCFALYAGPYVIERLYGHGYAAAVVPFQATMVLATGARILGGGASSTLLYAKDRQGPLILVRGGAAALNLALDLLLVPILGLTGAALATGFCGLAITGAEFALAWRSASLAFPGRQAVKIGVAAGAALLLVAPIAITSPLMLLGASVLYGTAFALLLALVRPFTAADLAMAARLHPRLGRLTAFFAGRAVVRAAPAA